MRAVHLQATRLATKVELTTTKVKLLQTHCVEFHVPRITEWPFVRYTPRVCTQFQLVGLKKLSINDSFEYLKLLNGKKCCTGKVL